MRSEQEVRRALEAHGDTVRRICFLYLKNREDSEDIFQNVFLRFLMFKGEFENSEHEKAWLVRVTSNACKDLLKSFWRRNKLSEDAVAELSGGITPESRELLHIVLTLPEKYRSVLYLHYFEEYTAPEIAGISGKMVNTIYTLLARGRDMLREKLRGGIYDEECL